MAEYYNFTMPLRSFFFSKFKTRYTINNTGTYQWATMEEYTAWRKEHNMSIMNILDTMGHTCSQMIFPLR